MIDHLVPALFWHYRSSGQARVPVYRSLAGLDHGQWVMIPHLPDHRVVVVVVAIHVVFNESSRDFSLWFSCPRRKRMTVEAVAVAEVIEMV